MGKEYKFPASAEGLLENHRKHAQELINSTDFLSPENGYQRIAHYALIDDLLGYLFYLENGKWPSDYDVKKIGERPTELGPFTIQRTIESLTKLSGS